MSTNANSNKPPNQGCNNVVNVTERDSANNSNLFNCSKSTNTSKPHSQSLASPRVTTIDCGNNITTNNHYNIITSTEEKNEITIQTTVVPKIIIVTHAINPGESTKNTHCHCYLGEHENYHNQTPKRPKLKSVAVNLMPPSNRNCL